MKITPNIAVDDFFLLESVLPILVKNTGVAVYDFSFRVGFDTASVFQAPSQPVVARVGPIPAYETYYDELQQHDIRLIHTLEEHNRCSLISHWYPLLQEFTPRTIVYDELPAVSQIESEFGWPVFVKGERQTSKHKASTSIIRSAAQFEMLLDTWKTAPILHWQKMVCREFVPLEQIDAVIADRIPSSVEFRLFYWKNKRAGWGRYWYEGIVYDLPENMQNDVFALADYAAAQIDVIFLVVDVALTADGKWIVIEVNDGQESGFAGADQRTVWESVLRQENPEKIK